MKSVYLIKIVWGCFWGLLVTPFGALFAQPITIAAGDYQIDHSLKLIVCNKIPAIPSSPSTVSLVFDNTYSYTGTGAAFQAGKQYAVSSSTGNYKLFFTNFPIISLKTKGVAISEDDNRTKGTVSIADGAKPLFTASMGIRVRGNTSRTYPKKSYNMELWKDADGNEELETSLFGMREDSKWLFMAIYNEPLRANNTTAWALWLKIHQLYYASQEAGALAGIRTQYCDVFINDSYNGVYILTEDLDRKQLKLKKTRDNGEIRGELYKAGASTDATAYQCVFNTNNLAPAFPNSATWSGYEMDYPKDPFWNNLVALTSFVAKSTDSEFKNQIGSKFKLDNLIDLFIFLNAIGATPDNFGNNLFVARYKENEPYMVLPWDFDVSYGNVNNVMDNNAENIRTNGFFYRLMTLNPNGFKSRMRKRWFALRQTELTTPNFKKLLTDNTSLLTNEGGYLREELKWPGAQRLSEMSAVVNWMERRMTFLDQYFGSFPEQDAAAVEITLQSFTGQVVGSEKLLQWATGIEKESSRFEIEFSTDGLLFSKVGEVAASNNSNSVKNYSFTHADASPVGYYRLKLINKYDLFTYSSVVLLGGCPDAPAVPSISASSTAINAGQSVTLKVTGCAHTVLWNTGQTGSELTVSPVTTTTYQARCRRANGCESDFSSPIVVKVTVPTAYDGYLNTVSCTVISGWAWDSKKPDSPVVVELLEGQNVLAIAVADIYRDELKTAGKGNGFHAYAFEPPLRLKDNQPHVLSARIQGSTAALKLAPKPLTCPPANASPIAPSLAPLVAKVNTAFTWTLPTFFDADYGSMFYSLTGLPAGLNFNPVNREITGTPINTGSFNLVYSANDGQVTVPANLVLSVGDGTTLPPANQAPQAPAVSPLSATVNAAFTTTLPVFTDTDALTYALSGLPAGLQFNNRQISGTPTTSGVFSLTYSATDTEGASTSVTVGLTVNAATSVPTSTTVTGNFEGYLDKVECGTIRGWVWDRNKPNTPLIIEFFGNGTSIGTVTADIFRQDLKDASKGNGAHAYSFVTPNSAKTGANVTISAKVKDSEYPLKGSPKTLNCPSEGGSGSSNQPPQAPAVSPLSATVNAAFSTTLPTFTDTDALTYALNGLPGGLQFNNRQISGTPTTSGVFSLTYSATDTQGASAFVVIGLTISSAPSVTPTGTVTGNFEGFLDKVECGSIRGWVWDKNKPNTPLNIEFFANGVSIGTAMADIFRQDLKDASKGNGAHAYSFVTPNSVKSGTNVTISAKVKDSEYPLKGSPKTLNCPAGSRVSSENADFEMDEDVAVWPNPSTGRFEIQYRLKDGKPGELSVIDASGRGWYRQEVQGVGVHRQPVQLPGAQGSFIIQLRQGNTVQSKKIMIAQ